MVLNFLLSCRSAVPGLVLTLATLHFLTSYVDADERGFVRSLLETRQKAVVVQSWDLSCGAAALTTLLNYQHRDMVGEKEVALGLIAQTRYVENPNLLRLRHGFSLFDLKRYVDARGYRGIGFGQMKLEDLVERAPIMVPITSNGYKHFVVFAGGWETGFYSPIPHTAIARCLPGNSSAHGSTTADRSAKWALLLPARMGLRSRMTSHQDLKTS